MQVNRDRHHRDLHCAEHEDDWPPYGGTNETEYPVDQLATY